MKDCIDEGEKFVIQCVLEIDCIEGPITCPNAVNSAYSNQIWMQAYPRDIILSDTKFMLQVYNPMPRLFPGMEFFTVLLLSTIFGFPERHIVC